jgi:hypothetical protein
VSADTTILDQTGRVVKQIVRRGTNLTRRYVIESAYDEDGPRNRLWVSTPGSVDYDMRYVWNDEGRLERLTDRVPATPVHADVVYRARARRRWSTSSPSPTTPSATARTRARTPTPAIG